MQKFFILIAAICTVVSSKCSSNRINAKIHLIGYPVDDIVVKWQTVQPLSSQQTAVTYRVYYNKTSSLMRCNTESIEYMYDAVHCNQKSSTPDQMNECTLKAEDIAKARVNLKLDYICIAVEGISANDTWYRFIECSLSSPESVNSNCVTLCPVPEDVHITAVTEKSLTVRWNAPSSTDKEILQEISFHIYYRRQAGPYEKVSNTSRAFKSIDLYSNPSQLFTAKNNMHNIINLEAGVYYDVKICCSIFVKECQFYSEHRVRTLEEEPSKAPIVTSYDMQDKDFLIKWKAPGYSTWNGEITRFEINVWKNDNNCTVVNSLGVIKNNITNHGVDIRQHEFNSTISVGDTAAYCGRVRMCTLPGCGPWSKVYSAQYSDYSRDWNTNHDAHVLKMALIGGGVGLFMIALILIALIILRRNRRQETPLDDDIDDVRVSNTSSTNETDDEIDNQYAVAVSSLPADDVPLNT